MKRKGLVIGLVVAIVLVAALRLFVCTLVTIPGDGEMPTLVKGDRVLVSRWSYGLRTPFSNLFGYHRWARSIAFRNDWIAFNIPTKSTTTRPDSSNLCVCRCLALPGDTVWMGTKGKVSASRNYSTGQIWPLVVPSENAYVRITPWNAPLYAQTINSHEGGVKATVENDSLCIDGRKVAYYRFHNNYYWMTSGNNQNLNDSRTMGFIPESCLLGRLVFVAYSLDGYKPRWARTLKLIP